MPVARRWAMTIAGGSGLLVGGAIGLHAGWVATCGGAAIGALVGALSGYANPALSQSIDAE
jgi:ABC-type dipeptide/oligopeptide/nickel transport system permease subunit